MDKMSQVHIFITYMYLVNENIHCIYISASSHVINSNTKHNTKDNVLILISC